MLGIFVHIHAGHMPIDFRQMMKYNHIKRLNIGSLIKPLSMWKRASEVFLTAGSNPALPACNVGRLQVVGWNVTWRQITRAAPARVAQGVDSSNPALPAIKQAISF